MDGLIATNTTIDRKGLSAKQSTIERIGAGGLSGAPLTSQSTEVVSYINQKSNASIPIIGVGGIESASTALDKINAGAQLVQVYSGLIYSGPYLIKRIKKAIVG